MDGPDEDDSRRSRRPHGRAPDLRSLRDQILTQVYGIDSLLPSSRALAGEMGVARSTVTVAYEQLAAEGFIETRHGARPRVARAVVERGRARASAMASSRRRISRCWRGRRP
ncbi:Transcriptional regulator GntR family domain Aspartate aminotransferase EC 2611 CDS [Bradyrhizobium sp.]|nr:Transcriptional regulator GntR family domain Aspartate aminotransferase EC 2611 CDS [Bradyrhizobium sp.]